jgi:hypothetical protein
VFKLLHPFWNCCRDRMHHQPTARDGKQQRGGTVPPRISPSAATQPLSLPFPSSTPPLRSGPIHPRRAHGESPPSPSRAPIVRVGPRGRALVSRDSRAGLACSLRFSDRCAVKSACGTALPGRGPRRCALLCCSCDRIISSPHGIFRGV